MKTLNRGKLSATNQMCDCRVCGKRTHSEIDGCLGIELCRDCFEYANAENEHSDFGHDENPQTDCPVCEKEKTK